MKLTFLWYLKLASFYKDGDVVGFLWTRWNPLSWLGMLLVFCVAIFIDGYRSASKDLHLLGFKLSPVIEKDDIEWFSSHKELSEYIERRHIK